MAVTRRDFLKYCSLSAAAIGLSATDLARLDAVLANENAPTVLWLQGSGCTGCSISFLNRVSATPPVAVDDLLVNSINLAYHPNIMAAAGRAAVSAVDRAAAAGGYVLMVEGGGPTAFGGNACRVWSTGSGHVTFTEALNRLAPGAAHIVCVGTCSSWGGIPAAGPNVTKIRGVKEITGRTTVNVSGCPPHPDWVVWAVAQLLLGNPIQLDDHGRPTALFSTTVHEKCSLREAEEASTFGQPGRCLEDLGCRGPETRGLCPTKKWNAGVNWCVGAGAPCIGCTEPVFPGPSPFYGDGGSDD